ncbi:hypothetical protein L207DRAFT_560581 [Hyaloscypha variabilis F]|uniref:CENP-V/GFA domain-containing protein n=1 Tax=Hyaloscypha variabilis (strain UAMH 11265 / GT02V1 / F) TaxID=1149755 RepID=A0A2J6SEA1_HYAVF|nr:hypothetical protein L207DRAFT_560581 [Hyaloscypha variabilis F]
MTTKGSCMCGAVKYEFTGSPAAKALCHCTDCQKWSGSAYTSNVAVPRSVFTLLSGKETLKTWDTIGDSGKIMPEMMFIKGGGLDGGKADLGNVDVELYVKNRVGFLGKLEGAKQDERMEY